MPGYVIEVDTKSEICGNDFLSKHTIHIKNERITPKECRIVCDEDDNCNYFFIYYNPEESTTQCITYKSCANRRAYTIAGTTYRKVRGILKFKTKKYH